VSCDEAELWRVFAYLRDAVEGGNAYQPAPEESEAVLKQVVACWRRKGFDPVAYLLADDAELPVTSKLDISDVDFSFNYAERLLLKERLHPILRGRSELDIRHTYECARRVVAFARKYPDQEFACLQLLPLLCADLPIAWHRNKCYGVVRCLLRLGFIETRYEYEGGRSWLWRGRLKQFNKARTFQVGRALRHHFRRPAVVPSPPPPVSIISPFGDQGCGLDQAAWTELRGEYDRLLGRVAVRGSPLAVL
jgi:hypothetical protein